MVTELNTVVIIHSLRQSGSSDHRLGPPSGGKHIRATMKRTRNDLPLPSRQRLVKLLNARLADAIDLSRQAKQAHWNVKGPNFVALHEFFDDLHTDALGHVDLLAERAVALGGEAHGSLQRVAEDTTLPKYPEGIRGGAAHVEALAEAVGHFGREIRAAIRHAEELGDAGSSDLFTEISRSTDQRLWMLEATLDEGEVI